jgi:hypothetical protein
VLLVPVTAAVKVAEAPTPSEAEAGPTVTPTGVKDTVALALLVGSAMLVAVIVSVCALLIVFGAVKTPFTMVPTAGLRDQVTAVLLVPVTEVVKVAEAPMPSDTEAGPTVTPTGIKETVALAVLVGSATLVAVIVTVCALPMVFGAV